MRIPLNISEALERSPLSVRISVGVLLLFAVCLADHSAPWQVSLASLYLLPVAYCAWFFSPGIAVINALAESYIWLLILEKKQAPHAHTAASYWNTLIHTLVFLAVVYIMRELRTMYRNERDRSHHDFLTGLENSRSFYELLSAERERAVRYALVTTVAYLDVDNFKLVNDRFGHLIGNELLITLANSLREHMRATDTIARLGGDEFALLMPHTSPEAAGAVLQKLRAIIDEEMHKRKWPATVSIGAVTFLQAPVSADEMLRQADKLMYSAKRSGKDKLLLAVSPAEEKVSSA